MRIVLDIDGVIANFAGAWAKWLTSKGIPVLPDSWKLYNFYSPYDYGEQLWDEFYKDPAVLLPAFAGAAPLAAAEPAVRSLMERHDVSFATYRPTFAVGTTVTWLEDVIGVAYPRVHHVKDKATIDADFYVDDHGPTVEALLAAGKNAYVFDQPWNKDFDVPRIMNWFHLADTVAALDAPAFIGSQPIMDITRDHLMKGATGEVRVVNEETGGQKGTKLARFDLIPAGPLWALAELYGKGAEKYAERNWELGYDWHLSFAAMMRHAWLFWKGEDMDPETGLPHMAAVMFHAAALMEFPETHPELDDRPGKSA